MARRAVVVAVRGELSVERDPDRPSGRLLRQAGMDASYVDLADPTHLEFAYLRWARIVLEAAKARRVLHLGGGACTLARALAAADPESRQEVCEADPEVLAVAREHLGLRRAPGLRVRHAEGRTWLSGQPDDAWEAVVIDAFVGARVPPRLITVEALTEAARVAPLTLVNVVDDRSARDVALVAAGLRAAYPSVWTLGARAGNVILVGDRAPRQLELARLAARLAADPEPARRTGPAEMKWGLTGTVPRADSEIEEEQ
jgi:hypothetical protein